MERNLLAKFHKNERNIFPWNQKPLNSWLSQALIRMSYWKLARTDKKSLIHFIFFGSLKLLTTELFLCAKNWKSQTSVYLVTLCRLGGKGKRGGGSKCLAIRSSHALIAPAPFFLVSSLWSFFRWKISVSVAYYLIDFPLFYRFPAFLWTSTSLPFLSHLPSLILPCPSRLFSPGAV